MARARYHADPATRNTPLQLDEVRELAEDRGKVLADARSREHFLARVDVTIQVYQTERDRLMRDIQVMQAESRTRGGSLNSLDAASLAQFIPRETIAKAGDAHMRSQIESLDSTLNQLRGVRERLALQVGRFRDVVAGLLQDPDIPDVAKSKLHAALADVPPLSAFMPAQGDLVEQIAEGRELPPVPNPLATAPRPAPSARPPAATPQPAVAPTAAAPPPPVAPPSAPTASPAPPPPPSPPPPGVPVSTPGGLPAAAPVAAVPVADVVAPQNPPTDPPQSPDGFNDLFS